MALVAPILGRLLEHPAVFELQQRLFNNYSAVAAEFADVLAPRPLRVLDIGCSTGACARRIIDMARHDYVGVDIDPGYIAIAQRQAPLGKFIAADARRLDFPDRSFDLAMFIGVMHHMDSQLIRECLPEVRRVLGPEGRLIVAEPVFTPGRWLSTLFLSIDRGRFIRDEPGYRNLFDGFQVVRQRYFDFSLHRFTAYVLQQN